MTTQNDPISQIKKVEEDAKKRLEAISHDQIEKLRKFEEDLTKKTEEFENDLREKGNAKLQTVKKEAGEILKSKMATSGNEAALITSNAEAKLDSAVKEVFEDFQSYIKA